ncbi:transcriptional regulator [Burkholderia sp. WAC0059]|uniref:winged helix-turn-helix transcriptional regulator n=1 Tax=Burkholderia sp. WAC0059 TaxID=2066022 RepID=UPI000C7F4686|nr:helix-turn-helix domain-containing protein [Burkholderia sp. WAC0059]PLZ01928.1 transcriptional regulator [Burkholderia sp. WAC0059]
MSEAPFRCGMEAVLDLVGGKWKLLILFHLSAKRRRFGELRRLVGDVSEKMLSQQLKEMTRDGLVRRIDFQTVPPHVEYELEAFGLDLGRALKPVCQWGTRNMEAVASIADARNALDASDALGMQADADATGDAPPPAVASASASASRARRAAAAKSPR